MFDTFIIFRKKPIWQVDAGTTEDDCEESYDEDTAITDQDEKQDLLETIGVDETATFCVRTRRNRFSVVTGTVGSISRFTFEIDAEDGDEDGDEADDEDIEVDP